MAFTNAQANAIRVSLGFSIYFGDLNPRLESQIRRVGADVDASAQALGYLSHLVGVDAKIDQLLAAAGVKKADDVEFFGDQHGSAIVKDPRKIGRMWVSRLSILMGVPIVGDIFGERGYEGDAWSNENFQYGGPTSGGSIPMG